MARTNETTTTDTGTATTEAEKAAKKAERDAEKAAAFRSLASARVSATLHDLGLIENLAGSNYVYTDEQVARIVGALEKGVADVKAAFATKGKAASFTL